MANNQHVNKVVFGAVSIIDITPTTAVESDVAQGKVFFKADGSQATGTNQGGSEDGSVTQDVDGYLVLSDESGTHVEVGSLSVTQNGTYTAPTGTAYSPVVVNVPSSEPSGIKYAWADFEDGAVDVAGYAQCSVNGMPVKDGHFRLWIDLSDLSGSLTARMTIRFNSVAGEVLIDWGDGSEKDSLSSSAFTAYKEHTYSVAGRYVIDIEYVSGTVDIYAFTNNGLISYITYSECSVLNSTQTQPGFTNAVKLKSVYVSDSVNSIGAFKNCTNLEKVRLSNNQISISASGFSLCTSLKSITIPASVVNIYTSAFDKCTALEEIHFLPTNPPTLNGTDWFYKVPSTCVFYVPSASLSAYQSATNWSDYASRMVGE